MAWQVLLLALHLAKNFFTRGPISIVKARTLQNCERPIFIGGTGRCGTSIMAKFLGSDENIFQPCHENKLIVEQDGLIDLLNAFVGHNDDQRKHFALSRFYRGAQRLREFGAQKHELNLELDELSKKIGFQNAVDQLQRKYPAETIRIHAIGQGFGIDHYDKVVNDFMASLIEQQIDDGIVDTPGLMKPYYIGKSVSRFECFAAFRNFLNELYAVEGDVRWIDDTPLNSKQLPFLFELFPNAKFIHMVRDPFDVADSMTDQVWSAYKGFGDALRSIQSHHQSIDDFASKHSNKKVLTVRLESLVAEPIDIQEGISRFLECDLDLDASLIASDQANIGRSKANRPLNARDHFPYILEWMERHGY